MRTVNIRKLVAAAFALAFAIAALALVAPGLTATAERQPQKQSTQNQQPEGSPAPMQPIQPVSVATINFQKLAEVEAKKEAAGLRQKPSDVEVHAPLTIPEPEESISSEPSAAQTPEIQSKAESVGPSIVSPAAASSFPAQPDEVKVGTQTRTIPPDTTGAVGPTKVFSNLNSNYRVQDKTTGNLLSTVSMDSFWAPLNTATPSPTASPTPSPVANTFDPRIQYDPYNGRWIVAASSNSSNASASILVGISADSDPQGTFTLYRFVVGCAAGDAGCNSGGEWADFPMLGFNKNWIAVGWNVFQLSGGSFVAGKLLILDYPALRAGTSTSNITTVTTTGSFCMHPATTYSATEETLYVPVHVSSASATYRLHKVTGTPSAPVFTADTVSRVRPGGVWTQPGGDILPQTCLGTAGTVCPTSLRPIDSGDAFIRSNAVFRGGNIWYAQTIGLPAARTATTVDRTAVQWTRLDTSGNFVDGGRIEDPNATPAGGEWYAYASIAVNANNDVLLGFSNFSFTHFARAAYALRLGTDAAGTLRDPVVFKDGEDYYAKSFAGSRNRWGDYSHSVVDPDNDTDFWTIQEYAGTRIVQDSQQTTNNSRWGTWWAKIQPSGAAASPTPTPAPCGTTFLVNSNGEASDASPGDGACATAGGLCTLRAAIEESNWRPFCGPVDINLTNVSGQINLTTALQDIGHNLSIVGPGAGALTIQRSSAGGTANFRIFTIVTGRTVAISNITIANGNLSGADGGGILNNGTLTMTQCNVYGNATSNNGGGIFNGTGSLTLNSCNVGGVGAGQPNTALGGSSGGGGGGVWVDNGTLTMSGGSIAGNSKEGLRVNNGTVILNGTLALSNTSTAGGAGIITTGGTTNVLNSLISGNAATLDGGGFRITGASTVRIINTTISGNSSAGAGGGVEALAGAIILTNATITNNRSDSNSSGGEQGGGVDAGVASLVLKNTIVAGNFRGVSPGTTADDFNGNGTANSSSFFNLIGACSGCGLTNGTNNNQIGVTNALLGPLANNGGATMTHALLACSPALNAGSNALAVDQTNSPLVFDQRGAGFSRISNGTVDIGAFEYQASAPALSIVQPGELAAVNSVTFVRGPFALTDTHNFSSDQRTRIIFFATDLGFTQLSQPTTQTLTVQLNGTDYAVEAAGPDPATCGSYVVFRLPDLQPGTYPLTIRSRGVASTNSPSITILASPNGPVSSSALSYALYSLAKLFL